LPRHPNPIWAGLAEDRLTAMVIADGHHIPDSLLRTVLRTKGVNRTVVVSDLSPVAGLEPGEHICFGQRVTLEPSGRVSLPGTGLLAASALPMFDAMNRLASLDWLSETDLLAIGFHNPLRLIGVSPSEVRAPTRLRFGAAALQFSLETTE
jgi:N-acetylglucosamine-6-phosphate deacetylase